MGLPNNWVWVTIGEIAQHNVGKTLNKGSRGSGAIREYITTSNLYWGSFDFTELRSMPIEEYELSKCSATKGDLLICEGGDAGRAAIWNYNYSICFQNHIHRVRPFGGISAKYLYYYMLYIYLNGNIKQYLKGVGIQSLSGNSLSSIVLPLPPIKEQQRIVNEIESLFEFIDTIEENKLSLEQFIAQAKSKILDLAIRGKLVPQEPEDEPASILLERIKTGKKSSKVTSDKSHYAHNVPDSWIACNLYEVCDFERGVTFPASAKYTFKRENHIACIRTANVQEKLEVDDLWYIDRSFLKNNHNKLLRHNDIIISSANSKELVGKTSFVEDIREEMCFGGFVMVIRTNIINSKFLFYYLRNCFNYGVFSKNASQTTNIANINATILGNLIIQVPPIAEQQRIVEKVEEIFKVLDFIQANLRTNN